MSCCGTFSSAGGTTFCGGRQALCRQSLVNDFLGFCPLTAISPELGPHYAVPNTAETAYAPTGTTNDRDTAKNFERPRTVGLSPHARRLDPHRPYCHLWNHHIHWRLYCCL